MLPDMEPGLTACGARGETFNHVRLSDRIKPQSPALSGFSFNGSIDMDTASFAGMLEVPALIAWLGSGPKARHKTGAAMPPAAREACRS